MREFSLRYELSFEDLSAMLHARDRIRFRKTKSVAFGVVVALQVLLLVMGLYLLYKGAPNGPKIVLLACAFLMLLFAVKYFFTPLIYRHYYRRLELNGTIIDTKLSPGGVKSSGNGIVSKLEWKSISFSSQTSEHFFLWLNDLQAVIIPLKVMQDSEQRDALWALIAENTETRQL